MNHGALALLIARTHKAAASAWAGELSNLSLSFRSNVLEEKEMSGSTRKSARRGPPRCLGSVSEHGTKPLITSWRSLIQDAGEDKATNLTQDAPASRGALCHQPLQHKSSREARNIICSTRLLGFLPMKHYFSSMFSTWKAARKTSITTTDLLIP